MDDTFYVMDNAILLVVFTPIYGNPEKMLNINKVGYIYTLDSIDDQQIRFNDVAKLNSIWICKAISSPRVYM